MKYYSLNDPSVTVSFKEATIQGQAPDQGLYFPEQIPLLPEGLVKNIDRYSREEIASQVISPYVDDTIPAAELQKIVAETVTFEFPLVPLTDSNSSLQLLHR